MNCFCPITLPLALLFFNIVLLPGPAPAQEKPPARIDPSKLDSLEDYLDLEKEGGQPDGPGLPVGESDLTWHVVVTGQAGGPILAEKQTSFASGDEIRLLAEVHRFSAVHWPVEVTVLRDGQPIRVRRYSAHLLKKGDARTEQFWEAIGGPDSRKTAFLYLTDPIQTAAPVDESLMQVEDKKFGPPFGIPGMTPHKNPRPVRCRDGDLLRAQFLNPDPRPNSSFILPPHELKVGIPKPVYPDRVAVPVTRITGINVFGHGIPRFENPWESGKVDGKTTIGDALPNELAIQLTNQDVLLVVRGTALFGENGVTPLRELDGGPVAAAADMPKGYRPLAIGILNWERMISAEDPLGALWYLYREQLRKQGTKEAKIRAMQGQQVAVFAYHIPQGSPAAIRTFSARSTKASWFHRGNVVADLRFCRDIGPSQRIGIDRLLVHDRFRVEIRLADALPEKDTPLQTFDTIDFQLAANGQPISVDEQNVFQAYRDPDDPTLYLSSPFFLSKGDGSSRAREGETTLTLPRGTSIVARPLTGAPVVPRKLATAQVILTPADAAAQWRLAVYKAAKAKDLPIPASVRDLRRKEIEEIEKKSFFVGGSSPRQTKVYFADLAALIFLRDLFIHELTAARQPLQILFDSSANQPDLLHAWREALRPAMTRPGNPIGSLEVSAKVGRGNNQRTETFPFAKLYNLDWLRRNTPLYRKRAWRDDLTRQALQKYLAAIDATIEKAKATNDDEVEDLLRLTALGFQPLVKTAVGRIMDLAEETYRDPVTGANRQGFVWKFNRNAERAIAGIPTLAAKVFADEELVNLETEVQLAMCLGAACGPMTFGHRLIQVYVSAMLVQAEWWDRLPRALISRAEADFARGAAPVLGGGRFELTGPRHTPVWQIALGFAGAYLGLGADGYALGQALRASKTTVQGTRLVRAVEQSGPELLLRAEPSEAAAAMARMGAARQARAAGLSLNATEARAATAGDRMIEAFSAAEETWIMDRPVALVDSAAVTAVGHYVRHGDEIFLVTNPDLLEDVTRIFRETLVDPDATQTFTDLLALPGRADDGAKTATFATIPQQMPASAPGQLLPLPSPIPIPPPPPAMFGTRAAVDQIANGSFAEIYTVLGRPRELIKAYETNETGIEAARRAQYFGELLDDLEIPQLRILEANPGAPRPYAIVEAAPDDAIIINISSLTGYVERATIEGFKSRRHVATGITGVKGIPDGGRLPEAMTNAILDLFDQMARKGLHWWDAKIDNLCLLPQGDSTFVAKLLDHDMIWEHSKKFAEGTMASDYSVMPSFYRHPSYHGRVWSQAGPPRPLTEMMEWGDRHPMSAREFMLRMLETHGWINYDLKTYRFIDGLMSLDHVRARYPDLDDLISPTVREAKVTFE